MIDHRRQLCAQIKQAWAGFEPMTVYDTAAVLYQLSYRVNWELAAAFVSRNIPVEVEEYHWM